MTKTRTRIAPAPQRVMCWLATGLLVGACCFWSAHARAAQQAGAGIGEVIATSPATSASSADLRVVSRSSTDDRTPASSARPHKRSGR
jgi:hypothetical protein